MSATPVMDQTVPVEKLAKRMEHPKQGEQSDELPNSKKMKDSDEQMQQDLTKVQRLKEYHAEQNRLLAQSVLNPVCEAVKIGIAENKYIPSLEKEVHEPPGGNNYGITLYTTFTTKFDANATKLDEVLKTRKALYQFIKNCVIALGKMIGASNGEITSDIEALFGVIVNARMYYSTMYEYGQRVLKPNATCWRTEGFNSEFTEEEKRICIDAAVGNVEYVAYQ